MGSRKHQIEHCVIVEHSQIVVYENIEMVKFYILINRSMVLKSQNEERFCSISVRNVADKSKLLGEWYFSLSIFMKQQVCLLETSQNFLLVNDAKCLFICLLKLLMTVVYLFAYIMVKAIQLSKYFYFTSTCFSLIVAFL